MTKRQALLKLWEKVADAQRHMEIQGKTKKLDQIYGWIEGVLDEMKGKRGK